MSKVMKAEVENVGFVRAVSQAERISIGLDGAFGAGNTRESGLDRRILDAKDPMPFQREGQSVYLHFLWFVKGSSLGQIEITPFEIHDFSSPHAY